MERTATISPTRASGGPGQAVGRLQRALRVPSLPSGARQGHPQVYLPLLHAALLETSSVVALDLVQKYVAVLRWLLLLLLLLLRATLAHLLPSAHPQVPLAGVALRRGLRS